MMDLLQDEELKQLPVTLAFKEFIHRKGLREPRVRQEPGLITLRHELSRQRLYSSHSQSGP